MKHAGLFDRVRYLENRLDRLEVIILEQDALIRAQAKILGAEEDAPFVAPEARSMQDVVTAIAHDNGLTVAEIKSRSRVAAITRPRHYAFAVLMDKGFSSASIGRFFGMDHTTVLHGAAKARQPVGETP